jgi:hypothetical protein
MHGVNIKNSFYPLNVKLNLICHLLALLAHHILHISRVRVKYVTRPAVKLSYQETVTENLLCIDV